MTLYELQCVQRDMNRLKSLYIELADHENFNPYKSNTVSDMPKGSRGINFNEWYTEEKERLEKEIEACKQMIQRDRRVIDKYIRSAPYPECDILRFRVINNMSWKEIGAAVSYSSSQVKRKFFDYLKDERNAQNERNEPPKV